MTTDKILDKLSKLKAAAEGEAKIGNTEAAEAFAGMINRMLLQHELSMTDIPLPAEQDPIIEVTVDPRKHDMKFSRVRIGWQEALARIVAEAHLCKFLVTAGTNYITFVGTKSHATVAEYAYGVLAASADRMSIKARDEYWRLYRNDPGFNSGNYRAAWINGFVSRIAERFAEARRAEVGNADALARAAGQSSTALVRLSHALVRADDYIKNKVGMRKLAGTRMASGCAAGRMAGREAANKVALGRKGINENRIKQLR
jgi:hypothetical protein